MCARSRVPGRVRPRQRRSHRVGRHRRDDPLRWQGCPGAAALAALARGKAAEASRAASLLEDSAGTCCVIDGEIIVSSNVGYDLLVSGSSSHPGLRFMTETPADFAACAEGESVSGVVFGSTSTPDEWVHGQSRTAQRVHGFSVSLIVDHGTEPLEALADASLTVRAPPASSVCSPETLVTREEPVTG